MGDLVQREHLNVNVNVNQCQSKIYIAPIVEIESEALACEWLDVIGRSKKVRFKTGLESSKTIRWADIQRKRVPVIRRSYTKSSRCKIRLRTGRNSKKVRVSGSQSSRWSIDGLLMVYRDKVSLPKLGCNRGGVMSAKTYNISETVHARSDQGYYGGLRGNRRGAFDWY